MTATTYTQEQVEKIVKAMLTVLPGAFRKRSGPCCIEVRNKDQLIASFVRFSPRMAEQHPHLRGLWSKESRQAGSFAAERKTTCDTN